MNTRKTTWLLALALTLAFTGALQAGGEFCGDGICEGAEDASNCADDCGCAAGACGGQAPGGCWCDCTCVEAGDCCPDAETECSLSTNCCGDGFCGDAENDGNCPEDCGCLNACGGQSPGGCFCDCLCIGEGDCCADAEALCSLSIECAMEACCMPDGSCTDEAQADCTDAGGVSQGENSSCDTTLCPQPAACCYEDSGVPVCAPLLQVTCESDFGGTYFPGETCDQVSCTLTVGACCLGSTCSDGGTQSECEANGGVYQGDDTLCSSVTCPQPGACCEIGDGSCQVRLEQECVDVLGTFQGPGTACDPNPCPQPGACCVINGCGHTLPSQCVGDFKGEGTTCASGVCPPAGACCLVGGAAAESNIAGSASAPCVVRTAESCAGVGGQYLGDNTTCEMDSCVTGACCMDVPLTTACSVITEADCQAAGGEYRGDGTHCYSDTCPPKGACCLGEAGLNVAGHISNCMVITESLCESGFGGDYLGDYTTCEGNPCSPERVDISTKGSLLIFSDVELEWTQSPVAGPGSFNITKDTVISLTNDYPGEVYVQMYFINGDPERDAVFSGGPVPVLISEQEPGCNWVDCAVLLTPDQSVYWSAASGNPVGCQPFGILDPDSGNGPGRPNPDMLGGPRVLRGYIVAWAVDAEGREINWNHLSGKATIVDYAAQAAWEYSPWAFQALAPSLIDAGVFSPGILGLDGVEYENAFDMLLFDFFAAGSLALSSNGNVVSVDTDLTLHPVSHDLRQEHEPPVTTKAHFDIWNMNERKLSNTRRCITCWDQVLLSQFNAPNNFLLMNLQSDKGKARIDGKQADECEENCFRDMGPGVQQDNQTAGFLEDLLDLDFVCSQDAALLGVAAKILRFGDNSIDYAGSELVGMGVERAFILYDVVGPPGTLRGDTYNRIRPVESKPTRIGGARGK